MNKSQKGYTLIELLIYTAIFAIVVGVFSGVLIAFTRVGTRTSVDSELAQQLSFVQSTVQRLVRESVNIENPAGTASSSLVLRMASSTLDPTIISFDANSVYLKQGTGSVIPITNSQVKISQFQVVKYENPGAHAIVQVDISLTYNSQNPYQQITRSLKIAIGRVTAASFDDSLIPNTDNAFSIGVSPYRWKNAAFSGDLTVAGNVGIGTTAPGTPLEVNRASDGGILRLGRQAVASWDFGVRNTPALTGLQSGSLEIIQQNGNTDVGIGTGSTAWVAFKSGGNVGIGTTNPGQKLTLEGTAPVLEMRSAGHVMFRPVANDSDMRIYGGGTQPNMYLGFTYGGAPTTALMAVTQGGNVGIGTTNPGARLDILGPTSSDQLRISNNASQYYKIGRNISTGFLDFDGTQIGAVGYTFSNGNVGIGTAGPTYQLQLSTDSAAKPSTNTWTVASDERIKTDIRPFTDGLDAILGINPVWYKYNGKGGFIADGKDNIGVIAQDIQKVAPYTVSSYYDKLNPADAANTELLNFNSGALTFTTINAIKELKSENDALKKRIEILETKIDSMTKIDSIN